MKNILIFCNSEGRGHLTQALAFKKYIKDSEYNLVGCILGTTKNKIIPQYFKDKIDAPIYEIESPQFIKNNNKSISLVKTLFTNIKKVNVYLNSIKEIEKIVQELKPDIIINFYEILSGLWNIKYNKSNISVISVGHQFLLEHSNFKFPDDNVWQQYTMKIINKLSSYKSKEKWCLSFYDTNDERDLKIIPPLLRDELFSIKPKIEDFYLVYLCNEGYLEDIKSIALKCNHTFKVFMNVHKIYNLLPNLTVYPLSDTDFLYNMSTCKGIMMSSGFESVCEAKYFNKPSLLVPIKNHYEQKCNAFDAQFANAGKYSESFNFIQLLFMELDENDLIYKNWVESCKDKIIYRLNNVAKT